MLSDLIIFGVIVAGVIAVGVVFAVKDAGVFMDDSFRWGDRDE